MNVQVFRIGIAKKTQGTAVSKVTGLPRYLSVSPVLWDWYICTIHPRSGKLIFLRNKITLWQLCLIEWFSGHNLLVIQWFTLTLFCVPKRWVWSMACTAHPTRTQLSAKATSQNSCQVYPHMLPAFSTLITLSVSASYSYLKEPLWERDSLGKRVLSLLSGLTSKLFPKPQHLLWHQFQTLAITHCDRAGSSQSSHPSQSQEAWKPWKSPCRALPTSGGCQNSSAICIKQLPKGFQNSPGQHVLLWECRGRFCSVRGVNTATEGHPGRAHRCTVWGQHSIPACGWILHLSQPQPGGTGSNLCIPPPGLAVSLPVVSLSFMIMGYYHMLRNVTTRGWSRQPPALQKSKQTQWAPLGKVTHRGIFCIQ